MKIPFVDLGPQNGEIREEVQRAINLIIDESRFIGGPDVEAFEGKFAASCRATGCVGVANGTDALELALRALGIGAGAEVLVPTNSFIASALAVVRAGAKPVLVDCDPHYLLIDVADAERKITPRTRAVMPVHLFGQIAPMAGVVSLSKRHGLAIIEDAAQAQGALQDGKPIGSWGALTGTSFYPGKNLGAWGDAGGVVGNDAKLLARVRALRNYGSEVKYHHPELGFNSRLDPIQAVVLSAKLNRLERWNTDRRGLARRYQELLADVPGFVLPSTFEGNVHAWHLFVIRTKNRDALQARLATAGIGTAIHYPVPIHMHGAMHFLKHEAGDFPVAEQAAAEMLSLPLYPGLQAHQHDYVCEAVRTAARA